MSQPRRLEARAFDRIFDVLHAEGFRVIGPRIHNQAIVYGQLQSSADLPRGWTDEQEKGQYRIRRRADNAYFGYNVGPQSWKQYLFVPREKLWEAERSGRHIAVKPEAQTPPKTAFLGVRACELAAIEIQDQIFIGGKIKDAPYQARREGILLIAVNCTQAGNTCFCVSMETGPRVTRHHDLALTEVIDEEAHYFLVTAGSPDGERILSQLQSSRACPEEVESGDRLIQEAASSMGRVLETRGIKELLYGNLSHERWDEVASRCLSCANCTLVCPTCFCSTVEDTTDLTGDHAERWRRWDSCFTLDHSSIHGGSVHASVKSRYRQWMTHKLGSWIDQFGTSGCVGCGRCITWCPVGIDITEETAAIRGGKPVTIQSLEQTLASHRFFQGLSEDNIAFISGCGKNVTFKPGEVIAEEGEVANEFYVIRSGTVSIETHVPQRGAVRIQTLKQGEVLGWSWLFPPYRWTFDSRALEVVHAVAFDGKCLRAKCEEDTLMGYV